MRKYRLLLFFFLFCVAAACASLYMVGSILISPKPSSVGLPPKDMPIEVVQIPRENGALIHGWFLGVDINKAGILLLHGVKSDRREMIDRARFLYREGYSVLLIDMQAHGETAGEYLTFGYLESIDAGRAVEYLRERIGGKVGIIGSSMGGAAALLGTQSNREDAIIIEGVYGTIEQAIKNRIALRLGRVATVLSPLLSWQLEPRLGISLDSLSVVNAVSRLNSPILIISGNQDRHALPSEAQAIFDAANQPKSLWMIEGASHEDLYEYNNESYEKRILDFFTEHLN